jgi:hypothetical protein
MDHTTRGKVLWAAWMGGGALVATLVVYARTSSVGWTVVALLAAGPVLNLLAQMAVQPARAVRGHGPSHARDEEA